MHPIQQQQQGEAQINGSSHKKKRRDQDYAPSDDPVKPLEIRPASIAWHCRILLCWLMGFGTVEALKKQSVSRLQLTGPASMDDFERFLLAIENDLTLQYLCLSSMSSAFPVIHLLHPPDYSLSDIGVLKLSLAMCVNRTVSTLLLACT